MTMDDDNEVKVFLTERTLDGKRYGEEICAHNWKEAEAFAARAGVKLLGEAVAKVCATNGDEVIDFIIRNDLVKVAGEEGVVFVWAANAAEQLDALLSNPAPIRAERTDEEV